jgi:hypothetical protein
MSLTFLTILAVFFGCALSIYSEGMWSNAVRLVNVVTAALLACNFFEPLARTMDEQMESASYLWDFFAIWLLFAVILLIMHTLTSSISRVNVRFPKIADQIGGVFFASWVSWVMVCFLMMTLHMAPLSRNFLRGDFNPDEGITFNPDYQWLGFLQKESGGAFCRSPVVKFDPKYDFVIRYASRRADIDALMKQTGSVIIRVPTKPPPQPPQQPHCRARLVDADAPWERPRPFSWRLR